MHAHTHTHTPIQIHSSILLFSFRLVFPRERLSDWAMQQLPAAEGGFLGSLCPGKKKLLGKTFYLDNVKKRTTALMLETISLLGGVS